MALDKMMFELVSPMRRLIKEEVSEVTAPGTLGEFGVLPGHRPFLTTLKTGEVRFVKDGKTEIVAISGGFAEVSEEGVRIMADSAEFRHEIDVERAQRAKARAEEKLKNLDQMEEPEKFAKFQGKLERAMLRIHVAGSEH